MCPALFTWVLRCELRSSCLHSSHFMHWVWLQPRWIISVFHPDHGLMENSLRCSLWIAKWWPLNLFWILTSILWLTSIMPNLQVKKQAEGVILIPRISCLLDEWYRGKGSLCMTDDQISPDLKVQDPEVRAETKAEMQKEWEHVLINANSRKAWGQEHLIEKNRGCSLT